jgi:hypothetical protein
LEGFVATTSSARLLHDTLDIIKCLVDYYPSILFIKNKYNQLPIDIIPSCPKQGGKCNQNNMTKSRIMKLEAVASTSASNSSKDIELSNDIGMTHGHHQNNLDIYDPVRSSYCRDTLIPSSSNQMNSVGTTGDEKEILKASTSRIRTRMVTLVIWMTFMMRRTRKIRLTWSMPLILQQLLLAQAHLVVEAPVQK